MSNLLLVLNCSDIDCRCVARKLRAERIRCRIVPEDISLEEIGEQAPAGLVLPGDAQGDREYRFDSRILQAGIPILALGGAAQKLLCLLGGTVGGSVGDAGLLSLHFEHSILTDGVEDHERMIPAARHLNMAECMSVLCTAGDEVIGYAHDLLPLFGIQLEAEQNDPDASQLLKNFAVNACDCQADWDDAALIREAEERISAMCGPDGRAVCALTGGLDSAVSALLAKRVLGDRLKCILVDTGFLREGEIAAFLSVFREEMGLDITLIDARQRFLEAVAGIMDSEGKKNAIRAQMKEILVSEINAMGDVRLVIRGISQNDILRGDAEPLPPELLRDSYAPVGDLFKEEIRRVAEYLGVPAQYASAQPFPGTGLALRIRGCVTAERLETLRRADAVFREEIRSAGVKRLIKFFAVLIPDQAELTRSNICLRAMQSGERDTSFASRLPYDALENTVRRILNERKEVNRVFYDLTPAEEYSDIESK